MGIFPDEAFTFYEGLSADNSKTYWTQHKDAYEKTVRAPMTALMDELAPVFDAEDVFIFRPYRDVRFSKDKTPYKTLQTGFLELESGIGYWVQVSADGVQIGGGFDSGSREQTARFRAAIDNPGSGQALVTLVGKFAKAGFELSGRRVKTRPRGFPPDHPRLELLRYEHLWLSRSPDPEQVDVTFVRKEWQKLKPFLQWVREHSAPNQ